MARSWKYFLCFKGSVLDMDHFINSLQRYTRTELARLQKFSCLSVFKNYINTLAQINNWWQIPSSQVDFFSCYSHIFLKGHFTSQFCSHSQTTAFTPNHCIMSTLLFHYYTTSCNTIAFSLKAYQENQLLYVKVHFYSLKKIKTLLKLFMSSAPAVSIQITLLFYSKKPYKEDSKQRTQKSKRK